mmetsp:Transcript_68873/g.132857  ORF Transcript_68873/g.132857 Transcript_68873/m.132857 type:complete len:86 (-) Transcript_68873:52-309(-)
MLEFTSCELNLWENGLGILVAIPTIARDSDGATPGTSLLSPSSKGKVLCTCETPRARCVGTIKYTCTDGTYDIADARTASLLNLH